MYKLLLIYRRGRSISVSEVFFVHKFVYELDEHGRYCDNLFRNLRNARESALYLTYPSLVGPRLSVYV